MTSESRVEILAWINQLLSMNITRIEQLGTGAAICQIFDSIYHDVPLTRVKFDAKHDYEYVHNFKVLQNTFDKHKIPNHIPVERLIKLKFQDNIEFIQFVKRFWDGHYPGGHYDAISRRKGVPFASSLMPREQPHLKDRPVVKSSSTTFKSNPVSSKPVRSQPAVKSFPKSHSVSTVPTTMSNRDPTLIKENNALKIEVENLKATIEGLEKERDFYFAKLREIEVLAQLEAENGNKDVSVEKVLNVLYATEEGFETPEGQTENGVEKDQVNAVTAGVGGLVVAAETF
ncbi:calponin homology domain-containing protein [Paraphysoderma sedebokerense]|nr:calponin homology domain-containing protein [Paraphysoderma sedebokerense]